MIAQNIIQILLLVKESVLILQKLYVRDTRNISNYISDKMLHFLRLYSDYSKLLLSTQKKRTVIRCFEITVNVN